MTWTRLSDDWSEQQALEPLSLAARWHYLCLIQFASRTERYEGEVRQRDALRVSDVDDPRQAIDELVRGGLLEFQEGVYLLLRIKDHVPPPHLRDPDRRSAQNERKRRSRKHKAGDHSICLAGECNLAGAPSPEPVTSAVTRDTGTGLDGTGGADPHPAKTNNTSLEDAWPSLELCTVCKTPVSSRLAGQEGTHPGCAPLAAA